jgi:hypothetical protein
LHLTSDALEWMRGGFSAPQLVINYLGFVPMPVMIAGLYAAQRPRIAGYGLLGALLYGFAFVYFAHTTLHALATKVPDYATLWNDLGPVYTGHGVVMVVGGLLFGVATLRARVLPSWAARTFTAGIVLNLVLGLVEVPAIFETIGSALRNVGLIGMGVALCRKPASPERVPGNDPRR